MPLAQLAEPWPKMELVQLETEVRGGEITALKLTDLMSPLKVPLSVLEVHVFIVGSSRELQQSYKNAKLYYELRRRKITKHCCRQSSAGICAEVAQVRCFVTRKGHSSKRCLDQCF